MASLIEVVLPTFTVIFIGFIIGKFTRINISPVVDINLYAAVPALVFVSLVDKQIVLLDAAKTWAAALIIMGGCLLVAWLVFKALRQKHSGLYIPIGIMNTVNIPFPVIFLAYGAAGLVPATLFYIPNNISLYTLGIFMMAGGRWKENVREIGRQPVIYASVLGLVFNFAGIKVPGLIYSSLDFLSKAAIPLVLLILGCNLSRVKIRSVSTTLLASFLRIGVGLALGFGVVWALHIEGLFRNVVILDSAMPAAASSALLAAKYNAEAELVSSVVFTTTIASLVVIPFLLRLLG